MPEASLLLQTFGERVTPVHMTEVNTANRHDPILLNAVHAFQKVAQSIPEQTPVILDP
jgi:hypothetical protein